MAESAWLSMTSAPNNGTFVLLKSKDERVCVGVFVAGHWLTSCCATVIHPVSWKEI